MMSCMRRSSPWNEKHGSLMDKAVSQLTPLLLFKSYLLVWDLQKLQDHGVRTHVPQQPLLLLPALPTGQTFLDAQLAEPKQDLNKRRKKMKQNNFCETEVFKPGNDVQAISKISTSLTTL